MKHTISIAAALALFAAAAVSCKKSPVVEPDPGPVPVSEIKTPLLKNVAGTTVAMEATGLKTGDKVEIADFFGFSATVDLTAVTATGASFELPAAATKDRSYTIKFMRGEEKQAEAIMRYDDDLVKMNKSLGIAITADGEVTDNRDGVHGNVQRNGSVSNAAVFSYNEKDGTFDASAADLRLCTFTAEGGNLDLSFVMGPDDLSALKHFKGRESVKRLKITDTQISELDMTLFPECETLLAWADRGQGPKLFKKVNFGTFGVDPVTKLEDVRLERHDIEGVIDMRQLPAIRNHEFTIQGNKLTGLNFGKANEDQVLLLEAINAEDNQIREISIENCGQLRSLKLKGNPIERLTLLNNSKQEGSEKYMYLFKGIEKFSFDPVPADKAQGERVINVERYWWRVYSDDNAREVTEKKLTEFPGGWKAGNPVVKALEAGYKVVCWTYHGEDAAGDSHPIEGHEHAGGSTPCE